MEDNVKNLNSGHRGRVRKRFIKEGNLDSFQDYEILELMLFYAYPMKDTKAIAKRLLQQYNTLHNLLNSKPEELMIHGGLTENVAVYLSMMPYVARRYMESYYKKGTVINSFKAAAEYIKVLLKAQNYESMYLLSLDANKKLIASDRISSGSYDEVSVTVEPVLEKALLHKAKFVILAHNHPSGTCEPSEADYIATRTFTTKFETLGIRLLDHIIICGDKNYSFANEGYFGMKRRY